MLRIDGHHLSSADIAAAGLGPLTVEVTEQARQQVLRSHEQAVQAGRSRALYGVTTCLLYTSDAADE